MMGEPTNSERRSRRCLKTSRCVIGILLTVAMGIYMMQDHLTLFAPRFLKHDPSFFDCDKMTFLPSGAGVRFLPRDGASVAIVFFHGNGDAADLMLGILSDLAEPLNAEFYVGEYRGYGCCRGWLEPEGLAQDASDIVSYVRNVTSLPIIIYGNSMGCASAMGAVESHSDNVAGLILENPWSTWPDLVSFHTGGLVPSFLLRSTYNNTARIMKARMPTLVFSSTLDKLVPPYMREILFEASPAEDKQIVRQPAGHNRVFVFPECRRRLVEFVAKLEQEITKN